MRVRVRRLALLGSAAALGAAPLMAADIVVPAGTTDTSQKSVGGTDTLTVEATGALSVNDTAIKWNQASTDLRITNDGTIESTASEGRAINAGGNATAPRTLTLTNNATGIIRAEDDAIRINTDITGGTVHLTNAGTILSTVDGQAIDFDAVTSTPDGAIEIDNLAGGTIQSTDADAIRPGQGAIINNAGTIYAGKVDGLKNDAIDLQAHSGTVHNLTGGLISGARHGITTDTDVTVINDAGATIIGRNGSGVGSDGSATVINYGTITGAYDGSGTGDGDGVDIDNGGYIENYGTIQALGAAGVHSDGHPNGSDGATIGGIGGTVINHAGALIYSVGGAVPITQGTVTNDGTITGGSIGVLFATGPGILTNTGTITGGGIGVLGSGVSDSFTNSGTISGGTDAITMGGGDDQLTLLPGSVLTGSVDGGDGNDQITLAGSGEGSFAGATNFEHLDVQSGSWTLTAASIFANGTTIESGGALTGSADVLTGAIDDAGILTVDQATDADFAATLTGGGQLVKAGAGTLTIGDQPFTGTTLVSGGTLLANGTLGSAVTVGSGAVLGGTGSVGAVTIGSGGSLNPGVAGVGTLGVGSTTVEQGGTIRSAAGGAGTLAIHGDLVQDAGSTFVAAVAPGQTGASLTVDGTATLQPGAQIQLSSATSASTIGSRYTLLSAAGGVDGSFTVAQPADAGTELRLAADANDVYGLVVRTAGSLKAVAATPDQAAVAGAIGPLGVANGAYAALTLNPSDVAVQAGLQTLAGEIHASLRTSTIQDAVMVANSIGSRLDDLAGAKSGLWAQLVGGHGRDGGGGGASDSDRDTLGGLAGFDVGLAEGIHAGVAAGYTRARTVLAQQSARGHVGSTHLLGYAGAAVGAIRLSGTLGYSWNRTTSRRAVTFDGFSDDDQARYHGHSFQGFLEASYAIPLGGGSLEPFVRGAAVHVHANGFAETGGAAALTGSAEGDTAKFSDVGGKFALPLASTAQLRASLAWQHTYGFVLPHAELAFAGGSSFDAVGTALSRNAASLGVDLGWQPTASLRVGASYAGLYGARSKESGGRLTLAVGF